MSTIYHVIICHVRRCHISQADVAYVATLATSQFGQGCVTLMNHHRFGRSVMVFNQSMTKYEHHVSQDLL
jgi:hypothetical protein